MKRFKLLLLVSTMAVSAYAQNSDWFYATTDSQSAQTLKSEFPEQIQILETSNSVSAVYMTKEVSVKLKENGNLHGPGYVFRKDKNSAIGAIHKVFESDMKILDFTIDQDAYVNQVIGQPIAENIGNTILALQAYGTRFNTKSSGVQASHDIKDWWQGMADDAGRTDITVEAFDHDFTNQISVILTIPGTEFPDEIVIIGGHLDSGDYWIQDYAPGADDNGSGIATLTEILRVLLANNFHPKRTVQIMGYAAEEIGLYGSADIAESYANANKDVKSVVQFDMTNYNGSVFDIAIIADGAYTSGALNLYLIDLLEHYNSSGEHEITYDFSYCGYACSDHVSWTENGYMASFPFEAAMGEDNPNIHTTNDTYAAMGSTAVHSVKFAKLGLEYLIETAKVANMGTNETDDPNLMIAVKDRNLIYDLDSLTPYTNSVVVFDAAGKKLIQKDKLDVKGSVSLQGLPNGFYISVFKDKDGKTYSKKFLIK